MGMTGPTHPWYCDSPLSTGQGLPHRGSRIRKNAATALGRRVSVSPAGAPLYNTHALSTPGDGPRRRCGMPRSEPMNIWALSDLCTPWCVHVAVTLRIAEHLAAGIDRIEDLAAAAGAHADSLHRVLRHLASQGVFEEKAPGRFQLNESARMLLDPAARLGLGLDGIGGRMAHAWGSLLQA